MQELLKMRTSDGGIDDSLVSVLLVEALGHLVGALVLSHLLAQEEDLLVAGHLLVHSHVDGLTDGNLSK